MHADSWRDNVPRREQYEAAHPEVTITYDRGAWTAEIPGRKPIVQHDLGRLLDALEALDEPHELVFPRTAHRARW
jgi:hypothetical protein